MLELKVVATLTEPMLGTVPKNADVYAKFIESDRAKRVDPVEGKETETVPRDENTGWTGFHTDEKGIFVYDYLVKGALKNAANLLKDALGEKNLRSKFDNYVFVFPRRIRILDSDFNPVKDPDGDPLERPLRAMTMQGPRVTLARSDKVEAGRKIKFLIKVVDGCPVKKMEEVIRKCMDYWQYCGFGQFRNGSYGRATVEVG